MFVLLVEKGIYRNMKQGFEGNKYSVLVSSQYHFDPLYSKYNASGMSIEDDKIACDVSVLHSKFL